MPDHVSLTLGRREALLRRGLYGALLRAVADAPGCGPSARVLDVGCGRGELLSLLTERGYDATGVDPEEACVAAGRRFARCERGGVEDLVGLFGGERFDVVVCSHVLEHLSDPAAALAAFRALDARWYVLAVPNPLRPVRIIRALRGSARPDHPLHVFAWGRPELTALLTASGFVPERWYVDRVTVLPFGGRFLSGLEERMLPRLFPALSSSLIVGARPAAVPAARAAD